MERFNSFKIIHKALRALLYDTALSLQQTNFTDANQLAEVIQKVQNTVYLFEQHAHHEDNHILPAIELYEPKLVADFEQDHDIDHALGDAIKKLITMFEDINNGEDATMLGSALNKAYFDFMVFNLEHMSKEEVLINEALWKHYTDEQLVLLNQILVTNIPAEEKALTAKWILRGVNDREAALWLKNTRKSIPPFVFESLLVLAENEMTPDRYHALIDEIMTAELAA